MCTAAASTEKPVDLLVDLFYLSGKFRVITTRKTGIKVKVLVNWI